MKVAAVQMVSTPRVDDNLARAAELVARAADRLCGQSYVRRNRR